LCPIRTCTQGQRQTPHKAYTRCKAHTPYNKHNMHYNKYNIQHLGGGAAVRHGLSGSIGAARWSGAGRVTCPGCMHAFAYSHTCTRIRQRRRRRWSCARGVGRMVLARMHARMRALAHARKTPTHPRICACARARTRTLTSPTLACEPSLPTTEILLCRGGKQASGPL